MSKKNRNRQKARAATKRSEVVTDTTSLKTGGAVIRFVGDNDFTATRPRYAHAE